MKANPGFGLLAFSLASLCWSITMSTGVRLSVGQEEKFARQDPPSPSAKGVSIGPLISAGKFAEADRILQAWRRSSGFGPDVLKTHYQFFTALKRHQECDVDVRKAVGLFVEDLNRAIQARQVSITTLIMAMPFATAAVSSSQGLQGADQVLDEEIQFVSELIDSGHFHDADSYASASSVLVSLHRSRFTVNCQQGDRPGATEQLLKLYSSWEKLSWSGAAELIPKRVAIRNSLISIAEMLIDGGTSSLVGDFLNQLKATVERWEEIGYTRDEEFLQVVRLRLMISKATIASNVQKALSEFNNAVKCIDLFSSQSETESNVVIEQAKEMALAVRDKVIRAKQLEEMVGRDAIEISSIAKIGKGPGSIKECRGKVVLLDFWAVWCAPCQKMLPTLNRFVERHKGDGLEVIGVTKPYNFTWDESTNAPQKMPLETMVPLDDEIEMLKRYHAEQELLYPTILTSKDGKTQSAYHVEGLPHLILIGRDGRIRKVWVGNVVETKDLEQSLQNALDESP